MLELEVHSAILDLLGLLPATPFNKINIHMGGVYGDKITSMERFAEVSSRRAGKQTASDVRMFWWMCHSHFGGCVTHKLWLKMAEPVVETTW